MTFTLPASTGATLMKTVNNTFQETDGGGFFSEISMFRFGLIAVESVLDTRHSKKFT